MAINIKFDLAGNPEPPTILLATRNGNILGKLDVDTTTIELSDKFNDASEISFTLHKYYFNEEGIEKITNLWDKVVDFKLVYCKEWDLWFEIKVELDEATETVKTVFCTQLGQAELSQIMLYNIEINTEDDIARDDYKITILYDKFNKEGSLLHRVLKDKAPHYSIIHVDDTIAKIQRTFSFDGISIYDASQEIAEEIGCLFVFHSNSNANGKIQRTISVYDLQQNCNNCGHRGDFTDVCPECGSTNIKNGYGEDTLIFVTSDELASEGIQLTTDVDSVKNCFKLEAGDDLMTATVRNCNPNGTDYIWRFSEHMKEDMSEELKKKIESYDELYQYYNNEYISEIDENLINEFNALIEKYADDNKSLEEIHTPIKGYSSLMNAYYNTVDLVLYLESSMIPFYDSYLVDESDKYLIDESDGYLLYRESKLSGTSAEEQVSLLTSDSLSPVSVNDIKIASLATVNSTVLSMAKIIVRSTYKVEIINSEMSDNGNTKMWRGSFKVTNYSNEEDTANSNVISIIVDDDKENFIKQKIEKALNKEASEDFSITGLFKKDRYDFCEDLQHYALNPLVSFRDACQTCLDILIEQGVGNNETWGSSDDNLEKNLYENLYVPYSEKLSDIEAEIKIRENEINSITGVYDLNGNLITKGVQSFIEECKYNIQDALDFEKYLGNELWLEFCSYRREDKYSNDNYISDGLNNAELFKKASEFYNVANKEIYKASELQHSISTTLNNLLAIPKFERLIDNFKNGNWMRVKVDDNIYKLRLLEYGIDYGNFDNIPVEFSDITKVKNGITDVESIISQASSMASSYNSVKRQAQQGEKSNVIINNWLSDGFDATNTKIVNADSQSQIWDEHGILCRSYDSITDTYSDVQLKIINSTMAITDDNWKTTKTAIGNFYYRDPVTNDLKSAYGINGEVIVGKLLLGEGLGIYNDSGSLTFNQDGFLISNGKNSFRVNPNSEVLLAISNSEKDVFYIDNNGKLHISGDGAGIDISTNSDITGMKSQIAQNSGNITTLVGKTNDLTSSYSALDQKIDSFSLSVVNGNASSTIKLMSGSTEISSQDIKFNGVVTFSDLENENGTVINGSNIKTGVLNADNININGKFKVYEDDTMGGYIGYMSGYSTYHTDGIGISNFDETCYAIITDAGVRLQTAAANIVLVNDGSLAINGTTLTINADVVINGTLTYRQS